MSLATELNFEFFEISGFWVRYIELLLEWLRG